MNGSLYKIYNSLKKNHKESQKLYFDSTFPHKIYRQISFPISTILIYLKFSPNFVTGMGFIFLIFSFLLLLTENINLINLGFIFYFCYVVLDFCDGNLARYLNKTSIFGKCIDGFVDFLSYLIFIPSYFAHCYLFQKDLEELLLITFFTSIIALVYLYVKFRISIFEKEVNVSFLTKSFELKKDNFSLLRFFSLISENILTGLPIIVIFGFYIGLFDVVVLFYFFYFSIICSLEVILRLKRIKEMSSN